MKNKPYLHNKIFFYNMTQFKQKCKWFILFVEDFSATLDRDQTKSHSTLVCHSHNSTALTSWIDQILNSNSNLVSNLEISYGDWCQDHIPFHCELNMNYPVEYTFDEPTKTSNLKAGIFWDQVTDDQIYLYRISLDDISIDL